MNNLLNPSSEITKVAKSFSSNKLQAVFDAIYWIKSNTNKIPHNSDSFRKITAERIMQRREVMGCTDVAILFLSFMKVLNIKATYIETMSQRSLDDLKNAEENEEIVYYGHSFCRVNPNNKSFIVDPTNMQIIMNNQLPNPSLINDAVIIGEGADFAEIGLNSVSDIKKKCRELIGKD